MSNRMILNKEQMKTLIREEAIRIRKEIDEDRRAQEKIDELKKRRIEIMEFLGLPYGEVSNK